MIHNMAMRIGDRLAAPIGLTSSRWMLLCSIDRSEQPPTIAQLSEDAMMSVQNISRMLVSMEDEGLIERSSKPGAGRTRFVRLTSAGQSAARATEDLGNLFHERFLAGLKDSQIEELKSRLDGLIGNLEQFEDELDESKQQ